MNVSKVRREMRHIECASHGCIDDDVFASTMPLRDQPDLLNSLGPGLRPLELLLLWHRLSRVSPDEHR